MTDGAAATVLYYNHTADVSGAEVVLLATLRGLDRARFHPVLVSPEGDLSRTVEQLAVRHMSLPAVTARFTRNPLSVVASLAGIARTVAVFRGLLKRERPDLVHANSIRAGLVATLASLGMGVPVLWHLHDILPAHPFSNLIRWIAQHTRATCLLAVSGATAREFAFAGTRRLVSKPVHVVYNGVDPQSFAPDSRERRAVRGEFALGEDAIAVGCVAQITPRKRQAELIEAFLACRQTMPQARLFVVGGPQFHGANRAYFERLQALVGAAGPECGVVLTGRRKDVRAVMNAMDVVVQNSSREPLGMTLMEALLCGKPVASTCVDGVPEVVREGLDGLLSPVDDVSALMEHVRVLVADASLRQRLGNSGRANVLAKFSTAQQSAATQGLYASLIAGAAGEGA